MKNISGQYQELLEGKMTQAQFLRNARMMFPNYVTNHNSFDDSVKILKTKGMLVEGDAVKGTPDKAPEYDYPTQPGKYKKVVQEPEVDEQDGIYPATTLTDIPKEEVSKPIKSKTRPDGLEDIKNNDTKNEMKKVKVVKENFDNNKKPISKINTATNFEEWIEALDAADTKEVLQSIYHELGKPIIDIAKIALKKTAGFIGGQDVRDDLNNKDRISEEKTSNLRERLRPAITKLVQEVLDEMSQK